MEDVQTSVSSLRSRFEQLGTTSVQSLKTERFQDLTPPPPPPPSTTAQEETQADNRIDTAEGRLAAPDVLNRKQPPVPPISRKQKARNRSVQDRVQRSALQSESVGESVVAVRQVHNQRPRQSKIPGEQDADDVGAVDETSPLLHLGAGDIGERMRLLDHADLRPPVPRSSKPQIATNESVVGKATSAPNTSIVNKIQLTDRSSGVARLGQQYSSPLIRPNSNNTAPSSSATTLITNQSTAKRDLSAAISSARPTIPIELPDVSHSSRIPPWQGGEARYISTGYDARVVDIYHDYVCAAGTFLRVWNASSGKLILSMPQPENTRISAASFRPSRNIQDDGLRLWVGNNYGVIQEIDIATKRVLLVNEQVHGRREIVQIHRSGAALWTLDKDGNLSVWPPFEGGSPDLEFSVLNAKLPRNLSASVCIRRQLWLATGKDINIFVPTDSADSPGARLNDEPLTQQSIGDITCASYTSENSETVCFGHGDGRVSCYSAESRKSIGTVRISSHKIYSLLGVGNDLWIGLGSGYICIFDISTRPWKMKCDWKAHEGPVHQLACDRSSLWRNGSLVVVSMGSDGTVGLWDGTRERHWWQVEMHKEEPSYCAYSDLSVAVMTWNVGATTPLDMISWPNQEERFQNILLQHDAPDIIVYHFQEIVDLQDKKLTAKNFWRGINKDQYGTEHLGTAHRIWRDYLVSCLDDLTGNRRSYLLVQTASLVGLLSCVFVKASVRPRVRNVETGDVKRGMGGLYGNKGSLITRLFLDDTSICFVNCHLAAGQSQTTNRNEDIAAILEASPLPPLRENAALSLGGDGSMIRDHEICIIGGDLNYRIDTFSRNAILDAIENRSLKKLHDRDQLLMQMHRTTDFPLRPFTENPFAFDPTYKYDIRTDRYDTSEKLRAPAWCDRILYCSQGKCVQTTYQRHEVQTSDHRPVSAMFRLKIKSIKHDQRVRVGDQIRQAFEKFKERATDENKKQYLECMYNLTQEAAMGLLQ